MPNPPSQPNPQIEQKDADNTSPQAKRPKLRLTIPNRHPTPISSNTSTQPTNNNPDLSIKATTAVVNQASLPHQHLQVFEAETSPEQKAPIFREVDYNRGKTDPASSISEHSPLSASLGRIACVNYANTGDKEVHGNETKEGRDVDS